MYIVERQSPGSQGVTVVVLIGVAVAGADQFEHEISVGGKAAIINGSTPSNGNDGLIVQ